MSIRNLLDVFGILLQSSTEAEDNDDSNLLSSEGTRHKQQCDKLANKMNRCT